MMVERGPKQVRLELDYKLQFKFTIANILIFQFQFYVEDTVLPSNNSSIAAIKFPDGYYKILIPIRLFHFHQIITQFL